MNVNTTHELARLLLSVDDQPVAVSVDMSIDGDEETYSNRCFGHEFLYLNPDVLNGEWVLCFGIGELNYDPKP